MHISSRKPCRQLKFWIIKNQDGGHYFEQWKIANEFADITNFYC